MPLGGSNGQTVRDYLDTTQNGNGKYYAYFEGGKFITEGIDSIRLKKKSVTVDECTHTYKYAHTSGTTTHSQYCSSCGNVKAAENCTFDKDCKCACGAVLAVTLPADLNLTYCTPKAA